MAHEPRFDCAMPAMRTVSGSLGLLRMIFLSGFVFLVIYNISPLSLESASSARIAILGMAALSVFLKPIRFVSLGWRVWLLFLPLPYVLAQYIFVPDFGQLSRFVHLLLYSYLGGWLVARLVGSLEEMAEIFLISITLQSVVILFSFFSIDYRGWVATNIVTGANFGADNLYRAPGLTSSAGSALSVIQSLGVLAGGVALTLRARTESFGLTGLLIVLSMLICMISCLVVGRTGLFLSGFFFLLFGFSATSRLKVFLNLILLASIALILSEWVLVNYLPSGVSLDYLNKWIFGLFLGEDGTASELASMPLPPMALDSFFGYGLISMIDGANPSGHDSGFVQSAYSMGFIVGAVFFLLYLFSLRELMRWCEGVRGGVLVLLFFVLEIKEPFVFKYATMFFLVSMYAVYCGRKVAGERA